MNSPRSLEACRQLGILPESLYYIDFKTYVQYNPEIIRLSKDIQQIRFDKINKYREETIQLVKDKREEIINNEEKKEILMILLLLLEAFIKDLRKEVIL